MALKNVLTISTQNGPHDRRYRCDGISNISLIYFSSASRSLQLFSAFVLPIVSPYHRFDNKHFIFFFHSYLVFFISSSPAVLYPKCQAFSSCMVTCITDGLLQTIHTCSPTPHAPKFFLPTRAGRIFSRNAKVVGFAATGFVHLMVMVVMAIIRTMIILMIASGHSRLWLLFIFDTD